MLPVEMSDMSSY